MAKLIFDFKQVIPLLQHTRASQRHMLTFEERAKLYGEDKCGHHQEGEEERGQPGLWLVKDDGIYLMSNGLPRLKNDGTLSTMDEKDFKSLVVYAEGYNPDTENRDELWDKQQAVSGDDFCELIPIEGVDTDQPWEKLVITLTETQLEIALERPPDKPKKS